MPEQLFPGKSKLRARAWSVGDRIDTRTLESGKILASAPLTVQAGQHGFAVLFRYGVAVLFEMEPIEEARFLEDLAPRVAGRFGTPRTEEAEIGIEPEQQQDSIDANGVIRLASGDLQRLLIVAHVLAKSAVLTHFEERIAEVFERIEPRVEQLRSKGRPLARDKELLREIGDVVLVQTRTVARAEISEKPELTWDNPDLDRLYVRLGVEYELGSRDLALTRKLELISDTTNTLLEVLQNRRILRVEWYIVILIVVEILISLYEKLRSF